MFSTHAFPAHSVIFCFCFHLSFFVFVLLSPFVFVPLSLFPFASCHLSLSLSLSAFLSFFVSLCFRLCLIPVSFWLSVYLSLSLVSVLVSLSLSPLSLCFCFCFCRSLCFFLWASCSVGLNYLDSPFGQSRVTVPFVSGLQVKAAMPPPMGVFCCVVAFIVCLHMLYTFAVDVLVAPLDFSLPFPLSAFNGFLPGFPGESDLPPSPPSFLPSSKLLRFDSLPSSNSGVNRFLLGPSVSVFGLRAFQSALVWMAALPHLWFALLSMLICFACSILVFGFCGRLKKHSSSNLKAKALACILMLLIEKLFLLQAAAWRSLPSSAASSHPLTSATDPFRPTHGLVPLLLDPLDESNNPLHNNIVHVESLLESEQEIVVLGSNGGISHVKNCAGNLNEDDIWISHPSFPEEATSPQVLPSVPSNYGLAWEGWSFEPVPNAGAGDCFWLALVPEVGPPEHARNVVASWLLEHHDHPATTEADDIREGALTSEWHVNATVQAYQHVFREGLCVLHAPTQSAILYTPGRFPATLHFSQYASSFRVEIPCLLYTHASTDATGHFERLLVHGPCDRESAQPTAKQALQQPLLLPCLNGGMFGLQPSPKNLETCVYASCCTTCLQCSEESSQSNVVNGLSPRQSSHHPNQAEAVTCRISAQLVPSTLPKPIELPNPMDLETPRGALAQYNSSCPPTQLDPASPASSGHGSANARSMPSSLQDHLQPPSPRTIWRNTRAAQSTWSYAFQNCPILQRTCVSPNEYLRCQQVQTSSLHTVLSPTLPFTVSELDGSSRSSPDPIEMVDVDLPNMFGGMNATAPACSVSSFDAETSIPHMRGGMLNATTPLSVVQQLQAMGVPAALANAAAARHPDCINSALDWACDSERRHCSARVDSTALPHVPTPPRSWGQLLAPVRDVEVVDLDTPPQDIQERQDQILPVRTYLAAPASWTGNIPPPLQTPTDLAQQYWAAARRDAFAAADKIYNQELQLAATNATTSSITERLCATFLSLPVTPPQHYSNFQLTFTQLYHEEARLLHLRVNDLHSSRISLSEACATPIDVIGLCPFPLAVACVLASSADIAPELVFAFFYSLCGWVCHHDLHAVFDPIKRDRRTRPRCMVQCICDAAAGKSPFWRTFVSPWFQGPDGIPSVFQTHAHLWSAADAKGLYIAQATDADLASRMQSSHGKLFWASPECWLLLDTAHAKRGADASKDKINFHYLLECQNGNDYGPRSIKSCPQQLHVATTNFGMLLLGQADTVHDFWGQVFRAGSPIRNKGFEGRPLFLFAGPARLTHPKQFISADLIFAFLKATLLQIADKAGHRVQAPFIKQPIQPQNSACWRSLGEAALRAEQDGPGACQVAAAKWGYSCGSHIVLNHLFACSFSSLPRDPLRLRNLLDGSEQGAVQTSASDFPEEWRRLPEDAFLSAHRVLCHTMSSLQTIYIEMCLPIQERAGTQALASSGNASSSSLVPLPERALAKTLRRCLGKQYITISDVKPHLTSTCRNQEHYCAVFDLAAQLQVGVPEGTYPGTRGAPYRLRLTVASMMPATRQRLGLEAGMGDVDPLPLPPIRGGGKRPASAGAKKQGQPRIAPAPAREAEGQQAAEQGERRQGPGPGEAVKANRLQSKVNGSKDLDLDDLEDQGKKSTRFKALRTLRPGLTAEMFS